MCKLAITIGLAASLLSWQAWAVPPAQALYGQINGTPVAIYAGDSSLGLCIIGEAQVSGTWVSVLSKQCGITQATLDAHGGAKGLIEWLRPDINASLRGFFGGGGDVAGQLDQSLNVDFAISGGQLVPKLAAPGV